MKNIKDLIKIWRDLKYIYNITYEVKEKKYPKSIAPHSEIVDSMWLLVKFWDTLYSSWRMDANCKDEVFDLRIEDLISRLDEDIFWIKKEKIEDLPF